MREENVTHYEGIIVPCYYEIKANDGRFWRFSTEEEAQEFAEAEGFGHINFRLK